MSLNQIALPSYAYSPLALNQTRVFKLDPGQFEDPLNGSFDVVTIPDNPRVPDAATPPNGLQEYDALSYAWGKGAFSNVIRCAEGTGIYALRVSRRVATALRYLRFSDRIRYVWIDAICINQSDVGEKSEQVRNMLRIFQNARQVIVWLGKKSHHSHLAFESSNNLQLADGLECSHPRSSDWEKIVRGFTELFDKPWWARTWVRQEAYAAKMLIIQCGDDLVDAKTFHDFIRSQLDSKVSTFERFSLSEYQKRRLDRALALLDLHLGRKAGASFELYELLERSVEFEVTDPRDRCYAVLGIANVPTGAQDRLGDPDSIFPVDYNKSLSEVYQDVVRHYLHLTKTLDILARYRSYHHIEFDTSLFAMELPESNRRDDFPSWVVKWESQPEKLKYGSRGLVWSAHIQGELRQIELKRTTTSQLSLKGYYLGTFEMYPGTGPYILRPSKSNPICNPGRVLVLDRAYRLLRPWLSDEYEQPKSEGTTTTTTDNDTDSSEGGVYTTPRSDDIAVLFYGAKVPFTLRPIPDGDVYEFLGPINMPAAMGGNLLQERHGSGSADARFFILQ